MKRPFQGLTRKPRPWRRYDAVVIGAGSEGLTCANLWPAGLRVPLVEQHYGRGYSSFQREVTRLMRLPLLSASSKPGHSHRQADGRPGSADAVDQDGPGGPLPFPRRQELHRSCGSHEYLTKVKAEFPLKPQQSTAFQDRPPGLPA